MYEGFGFILLHLICKIFKFEEYLKLIRVTVFFLKIEICITFKLIYVKKFYFQMVSF